MSTEKAQIVAYLRRHGERYLEAGFDCDPGEHTVHVSECVVGYVLIRCADAIERGEHRKENEE